MTTPLPTWEEFCVPVLKVLDDGRTRTLRELRREVADTTHLTAQQRAEAVPSGQTKADNRIGWAASYLRRVGALDRPSRGHYKITDAGRGLLAANPGGITELDLRAMAKEGDEWWISKGGARSQSDTEAAEIDLVLDPTEQVELGVARIHDEVARELLDRLLGEDPAFFEQAVVDLLLAMGYGGIGGSGMVTATVHDGGIDGVIDQDVLGLRKIYIQAKRYARGTSVGRPDVQTFVGALTGRADGGVFFTTSHFSSGAIEWARSVPGNIILVDGDRLAKLMIEYGVGVQVHKTYQVVKVDEDFFS